MVGFLSLPPAPKSGKRVQLIERQVNMETEQKAVDYQAVLADLESKKDELDKAITAIKRIMGDPTLSSDGQTKQQGQVLALTPTAFFGMSVADAAKKYLAIVKEPKSTPDIASALQKYGMKTVAKNFTLTVFSSLERRERVGEVVRPKRGLWGLAEWYPGMRKDRKENGEQKPSTESPDEPEVEKKATGRKPKTSK